MGRLFGTDGVRGIANEELTPQLAFDLGKAGAKVLTAEKKHAAKILVGTDTRISCDMLKSALVAGICSVGAEAICVGVIPTPAVAHLTRYYNADAGVVISASHNPFEFNGIKFFDSRGYKLADETEDKIEEMMNSNFTGIEIVTGKHLGKMTICEEACKIFEDYLISTIDGNLDGLKIALDCANGAAYSIAPNVFRKLGADVIVINNEPNGVNINDNCGSTHLEDLKKCVLENNVDIGLAFDGDADRVLAVDNKGQLVDGDKTLAILGKEMNKRNNLKNSTIVVTVMSNIGFDIFAKENDISVTKTKVGDRYVLEEMINHNYKLGGEQSGHVIMLDYNTTGDGVLTGIKLAKVLKDSNKKMEDLASIMEVYPQVLVNAKVINKNKYLYLEDEIISKQCKILEDEFGGDGRVLIRPSGTEPLVRVMIEGKDIKLIQRRAQELANIIEQRLGQ